MILVIIQLIHTYLGVCCISHTNVRKAYLKLKYLHYKPAT